jgi:NADH:ubiquinone oxidoreductase subunit 5 (subunit L)/multisubunit Na+/H+ antiporter MnhA subunit
MIAAILIPILGGLVIPLFPKGRAELRNVFAAIVSSLPILFIAAMMPGVLRQPPLVSQWELPMFRSISLLLLGDGLSVFVAFASALVGALVVIYSIDYVRPYPHQSEFYTLVLIFQGSMMGLVFSGNLVIMYVFWELTAICSWRLIGFHRQDPKPVASSAKALLVTVFGSACMLLGFKLINHEFGTFSVLELRGHMLSAWPLFLVLLGILAKSAQFPLQTWLPDAGVAPAPVTALLHAAALVKIGVYAFARIFLATFTMPPASVNLIIIMAALSVFVAACSALVENDIKRILAYSTISQIAYIVLGLAIGTPLAVTGALFYILVHGLGKAGLFLGAGVVEQYAHEKDIRKLGGMRHVMPITALGFFLNALSVMGIPPFGGFFAKLFIIMGAIQTKNYFVAGLVVGTAILTLIYLMRLWTKVFNGPPTHPWGHDPNRRDSGSCPRFENRKLMPVVVMIFAVLSLISFLVLIYPLNLVGQAVAVTQAVRTLRP